MFRFIFIILFLTGAGFCELLLASCGWLVPVSVVAVFCLAVVSGWRPVLVPGMLFLATIDCTLGRSTPTAVVVLFPVMALAMLWRHHGDCRHLAAQVFPGLLVGGGHAVVILVFDSFLREQVTLALLMRGGWLFVVGMVSGGLCLPVLCRFHDRLARATGGRLYVSAGTGDFHARAY